MKDMMNKLDNGWQLARNEFGNYFIVNATSLMCVLPDRAKKFMSKGYACVDLSTTEYAARQRALGEAIDRLMAQPSAVVIREYQMTR